MVFNRKRKPPQLLTNNKYHRTNQAASSPPAHRFHPPLVLVMVSRGFRAGMARAAGSVYVIRSYGCGRHTPNRPAPAMPPGTVSFWYEYAVFTSRFASSVSRPEHLCNMFAMLKRTIHLICVCRIYASKQVRAEHWSKNWWGSVFVYKHVGNAAINWIRIHSEQTSVPHNARTHTTSGDDHQKSMPCVYV